MHRIELEPIRRVTVLPAPVMLEVVTANRSLCLLTEPDPGSRQEQVVAWPDRSVFTIDDRTGLFQAQTPYGDFAYHWPPAYRSCDLFTFLASLDFGYFMGKASSKPYREPDWERTFRNLRKEILEHRRKWGDLTRDQARGCWEELESIERNQPFGEEGFYRLWWDSPDLSKWTNSEPVSISYRDTFAARHFWDVIWQALVSSEAFRSYMKKTEAA